MTVRILMSALFTKPDFYRHSINHDVDDIINISLERGFRMRRHALPVYDHNCGGLLLCR